VRAVFERVLLSKFLISLEFPSPEMVGVTGSVPVAPTIPEPQNTAVLIMSPAEKLPSFNDSKRHQFPLFGTFSRAKSVPLSKLHHARTSSR
jgi:hypothetical protein